MTLGASFVIRFLLAALSVYRLAWMTKEDGPFGIFLNMRNWLGKMAARERHASGFETFGPAWTIAEISNCPHCIGVWLAILFAPFVIFPNFYTDMVMIILAISGLQSLFTGRSD